MGNPNASGDSASFAATALLQLVSRTMGPPGLLRTPLVRVDGTSRPRWSRPLALRLAAASS